MKYEISISSHAERDISKLPSDNLYKVDTRILELETNPRPADVKKLTSKRPPVWRIRAGQIRILYSIDDAQNQVVILRVVHRSQAYR